MSQHSNSWLSFILRLWCGNDRSSTAHGKNKRGRSRSSSSNNIPFSAEDLSLTLAGSNLPAFTLAEMEIVTRNFSPSNKVGSGGFGTVYKGFIPGNLRPGLEAQYVAVKDLDLDGLQGHREWLTEVMYLGQLTHPNLVKLIGYCWEDERRLVVYEFMRGGNLEDHLFKGPSDSLSWSQRMKIAVQTAKGLAFLHEAEKQIIYRDFKASNILLDLDYTAKLSDFGLAKEGPEGDATHVSTRVMGTNGYAAPEYIMTGHLTTKSDVYSFGVVLLELLTNKRAIDTNRKPREHNLVEWAKPYLNKPDKLFKIMDQSLGYSREAAQKAAFIAYQCLSMTPKRRPHMREVVNALEPILEMPELLGGSFVCMVMGHESCENIGGDFEKVALGEDGDMKNKRKSPISAIHDDQLIGGHFMEPIWREEIMKME